jgi:SAM-dependent methyltransferase
MRVVPFEAEFDAVINIFTAFGYFDQQEEDQQVLHQVARALKPGGLFLLDFAHREGIVRRFAPQGIQRHDDGLLVLEERQFDLLTSRIAVAITMIEPDGSRKEYGFEHRLYSLTELRDMMATAGLTVTEHYGGLDGRPLTLDSKRLVILSRKELA